jgi:hypothetical protein
MRAARLKAGAVRAVGLHAGNAKLVYAVLRNKSLFNALATFDYATAVAKTSVTQSLVR